MKWTWTSYGGCESVTGSQHVLTTPSGNILLDCGLFQGRRSIAWQRNQELNYNPEDIKAVVLSHAHIDHSGKLPFLIKNGYTGPIYCTFYTARLIKPLLLDCAHVMEDDYRYLKRKKKEVLPPLYDKNDVKFLKQQIHPLEYNQAYQILPHVTLTLHRAGHILGAALVQLENANKNVLFTGDIGPHPSHFLHDREIPQNVQHLFMESTYGGRNHKPFEENLEDLRIEIRRIQETKGKIVIPSFAMERTQQLLALLNKWIREKRINPIPIYMDSPLGIELTKIYESAQDEYKPPFHMEEKNIFKSQWIHVMESPEQSKSIHHVSGPMIIISSSGMCEGGRVLHHIKNNCHDPKNTILIVGFQAENTLGRKIVERAKTINVYGSECSLNCRVKALNGFSSHGDQEDLIEFAKELGPTLQSINLVHGEASQRHALKERLKIRLGSHYKCRVHLVAEKKSLKL